MAASLTSLSLLTLLYLNSFFFPSLASTASRPFKKIYAFGDSFTDTGNTRSVSGSRGFAHVSNPPYGTTFFHHPTNRYSDGRLVIDFVAESLSLPYLPPYLHSNGTVTHGVNFAVGGSTAINHAFFVINNITLDITPQSIQTQLIWFDKFLKRQGCRDPDSSGPECRAVFDDALFWVGEIGVNDYAYTFGSTVTIDTVRRLAVSSVTAFLQALLKRGAKYIVVQGLPPSGCLPLSFYLLPENERDDIGCVKSVNNHTYTHNAVYLSKLQDLRRRFPDAVVTYVDYWNSYHAVMKNPEAYGFQEPFKACCGSGDPPYNFNVFDTCGTPSTTACKNPSQYINWDGVHLTEGMYKVLANMFINGSFSHPPFGYLLHKKQNKK